MARRSGKPSRMRRLEVIRDELLKKDEVSIDQMARMLKVSAMTVRRDLENLEKQGEVLRTHGGAALAKRLTFEFSFRDRQNKGQEHKRLIAEQAVRYVEDGHVVILDTGTTTLAIARQLAGKRQVTLITTSLAIVSAVQFSPGIDVVLLGGFLRRGSPDLHGPLTEQNVEQFKADIAFMGADAIADNGNTYTDDLRVLNLDRKMAANAKKVIVVADSNKFGKSAMCRVFTPDDYNLLITDSHISKDIARKLSKKKINIQLV